MKCKIQIKTAQQRFSYFAFILMIFCTFSVSLGQHWVNPNYECQRLELRDLGYLEVNIIPPNCSAITSLVTAQSGKIYGATSGDAAYLFVYDPKTNKVKHLGRLAGHQGVYHSLVMGREGCVYIGTGKNVLEEVEISKQTGFGDNSIDNSLWNDIKKPYYGYKGGHLLRYDPTRNDGKVYLADHNCPAEDLGVPVPGDGIYALTIDGDRSIIYGLTYPNGHIFKYQTGEKIFCDLGETNKKIVFHGPERDWRTLPRALICDDSGRVFTSGSDGFLYYYEPGDKFLSVTDVKLPGEYYPVQLYEGYPTVECFAKGANGLIYGASCDGFFFSFEPDKMKLNNFGKPRVSRRMRALTGGCDGKVYMIAGERTEPCRLFSYNPQGGVFSDLGVMAVDRSPYYCWRGDQFECMTTGLDGTIYVGESDRRGHLFIYLPPARPVSD
jgi:hypothetical protein